MKDKLIKTIEFSQEINGFIITLHDGRIVQTYFVEEPLGSGIIYPILDRVNDYGLSVSKEEEIYILKFIVNNQQSIKEIL